MVKRKSRPQTNNLLLGNENCSRYVSRVSGVQIPCRPYFIFKMDNRNRNWFSFFINLIIVEGLLVIVTSFIPAYYSTPCSVPDYLHPLGKSYELCIQVIAPGPDISHFISVYLLTITVIIFLLYCAITKIKGNRIYEGYQLPKKKFLYYVFLMSVFIILFKYITILIGFLISKYIFNIYFFYISLPVTLGLILFIFSFKSIRGKVKGLNKSARICLIVIMVLLLLLLVIFNYRVYSVQIYPDDNFSYDKDILAKFVFKKYVGITVSLKDNSGVIVPDGYFHEQKPFFEQRKKWFEEEIDEKIINLGDDCLRVSKFREGFFCEITKEGFEKLLKNQDIKNIS